MPSQKAFFNCVCFVLVCLFRSASGLLRLRIICAVATDIHVQWNLNLMK